MLQVNQLRGELGMAAPLPLPTRNDAILARLQQSIPALPPVSGISTESPHDAANPTEEQDALDDALGDLDLDSTSCMYMSMISYVHELGTE